MFCTAQLKSTKKKAPLEDNVFRKGIVLLDQNQQYHPAINFEGQVSILHHSSTIQPGYESVFHCGVIRQTVKIIGMSQSCLRTGDKDMVKFKLCFSPELL